MVERRQFYTVRHVGLDPTYGDRIGGAQQDLREFLREQGLPPGDLHELPDSPKRFPDGAQYRVEIPSTEGPSCLAAVLTEAQRLDVRVHRVSQGSGVFLQTDAELQEMARLAVDARVEVSLFARPNAAWGVSATARAHAGSFAARPRRSSAAASASRTSARTRSRISARPPTSASSAWRSALPPRM